MKPTIFISHSVADRQAASRVSDELRRYGYKPYVATEDVIPGMHISKKIEEAIDQSNAFIVILTESSVKSPWVLQEIGYAKGRVPIVPIRYPNVDMPPLLQGCECINFEDNQLKMIGDLVKGAISSWSNRESRSLCNSGPYLVDSGSYIEIELGVKEGDHVTGRIEETDGDEFDWYILDERNLISFKRKEGFSPTKYEEDVGMSSVNWRVKGRKTWFLVLQVYGKRNPREVSVHLRTSQ